MRLRTVAKLGMVLSVVLFCTAVGFYGFAKLSLTDKSREINLFSLVPAHLTAQTMSSVSGIFVQTSQHIIKQTGKLEITQFFRIVQLRKFIQKIINIITLQHTDAISRYK